MNDQPNPAQPDPDFCRHGTPGCHPCQQCDEDPTPPQPAPKPESDEWFEALGDEIEKYPITGPPKPSTAPDRHEASRAAFEDLMKAELSTTIRTSIGSYAATVTALKWEWWCRALDHAAQEQPIGVTMSARCAAEFSAKWDEAERELFDLRTKLAAAEHRVERLREALELIQAHMQRIDALPWGYDGDCGAGDIAEDAHAIARAALAETKEDHTNG